MTSKRVVLLEQAERDLEDAFYFYGREAGRAVALKFVEGWEAVLRSIHEHPAIGSTHHAHAVDLPGLRSLGIRRFPYLAFYMEHDDRIDVWRVLHAQRDLQAWVLPQ